MYKDCFARGDAKCKILKEVVCEERNCPFYKTKRRYEADKIKYPHIKMKERGKSDE